MAVTVFVADAIEEQGEQDFGEAVVTANGLVLMYGLYSRAFHGPVPTCSKLAFWAGENSNFAARYLPSVRQNIFP